MLSVQVGWETGTGGAVPSESQTQGKKMNSGNKNLPCGPLEAPGFGIGAKNSILVKTGILPSWDGGVPLPLKKPAAAFSAVLATVARSAGLGVS